MTIIESLEAMYSDHLPAEYPDEQSYKVAWQRITTSDLFLAALQGGLIADRLSWVFLAAYQSAVRACFDGLPSGRFISYAASEDRTGEYPGASIDENSRLQGNKSWIASSKTVDGLLVTVGDSIIHVPADREGISLTHRESPAFLGDLSQGMAAFKDVVIQKSDYVRDHRVSDFRIAEPFFVTVSACGFLWAQYAVGRSQLSDIVNALHDIYSAGFTQDANGLLGCHQRLKSVGKACAAELPSTDWSTSGGLLGMYRANLEALTQSD